MTLPPPFVPLPSLQTLLYRSTLAHPGVHVLLRPSPFRPICDSGYSSGFFPPSPLTILASRGTVALAVGETSSGAPDPLPLRVFVCVDVLSLPPFLLLYRLSPFSWCGISKHCLQAPPDAYEGFYFSPLSFLEVLRPSSFAVSLHHIYFASPMPPQEYRFYSFSDAGPDWPFRPTFFGFTVTRRSHAVPRNVPSSLKVWSFFFSWVGFCLNVYGPHRPPCPITFSLPNPPPLF